MTLIEPIMQTQDEAETLPTTDADLSAEVDAVSPEIAPKRKSNASWWLMIRRFFFRTAEERDQHDTQRLHDLNHAIEMYPQAAANYVLRGELFLQRQQTHLAQADFERALTLAQADFEETEWGAVSQALIDRALQGLRQCGAS